MLTKVLNASSKGIPEGRQSQGAADSRVQGVRYTFPPPGQCHSSTVRCAMQRRSTQHSTGWVSTSCTSCRTPRPIRIRRRSECRFSTCPTSSLPIQPQTGVFLALIWSQNAWGKLFTKCSFPMTGTSDAKPFEEESGPIISIDLSTGRVIFHLPAFSGLPEGKASSGRDHSQHSRHPRCSHSLKRSSTHQRRHDKPKVGGSIRRKTKVPASLVGSGEEGGEMLRCRGGSCASVYAWRCNYNQRVSLASVPNRIAAVLLVAKRPLGRRYGERARSRGPRGLGALFVRGGARIPNGVTSSETNPLGDRSVLLLGLGQLLLGTERLVALQRWEETTCQPVVPCGHSRCQRPLRPSVSPALGVFPPLIAPVVRSDCSLLLFRSPTARDAVRSRPGAARGWTATTYRHFDCCCVCNVEMGWWSASVYGRWSSKSKDGLRSLSFCWQANFASEGLCSPSKDFPTGSRAKRAPSGTAQGAPSSAMMGLMGGMGWLHR